MVPLFGGNARDAVQKHKKRTNGSRTSRSRRSHDSTDTILGQLWRSKARNRMKGLGVTNTLIPRANYGFSIIPITQDSSPFQRIRNEQTSFHMFQRENRIKMRTVTESRQHSLSPWSQNSIGIALFHRFQCKAEIRTEWMCLVVVLSAFHS